MIILLILLFCIGYSLGVASTNLDILGALMDLVVSLLFLFTMGTLIVLGVMQILA